MALHATRRNFLRTAPLAAATLSLADLAIAQTPTPAAEPIHFFTAGGLSVDVQELQGHPGIKNLVDQKTSPFAIVMTTETTKVQKEFEWHEGRDHIVQILDGSCVYEVAGTPTAAHQTKPGEWLTPTAKDFQTIIMNKGDMLTIPRNTLHKRTTKESVTFLLISPSGKV